MWGKHWDSTILAFIDSSEYATGIRHVKDFLLDIPIEKYGHAWTSQVIYSTYKIAAVGSGARVSATCAYLQYCGKRIWISSQ